MHVQRNFRISLRETTQARQARQVRTVQNTSNCSPVIAACTVVYTPKVLAHACISMHRVRVLWNSSLLLLLLLLLCAVYCDLMLLCAGISFPTLPQLLEELKDVDWFLLGIFLGVPLKQLHRIESSYRQGVVERCKIDMLQYWLDNNVSASWKDVVRALEQTDQIVLAVTVKQKYLLSPTIDEGDSECYHRYLLWQLI